MWRWFRRKGVWGVVGARASPPLVPAQGRLGGRWRKGVIPPGFRRKGVWGVVGARASPPLVPAQGRLWAGRMSASLPRAQVGVTPRAQVGVTPQGACRRRPRTHVGPGGGGYRAKCMSTGHGGGLLTSVGDPLRPHAPRRSAQHPFAVKDAARLTEGGALCPPRASAPKYYFVRFMGGELGVPWWGRAPPPIRRVGGFVVGPARDCWAGQRVGLLTIRAGLSVREVGGFPSGVA